MAATPVVLVIVRLLKAVEPLMIWAAVPLKVTVPVPAAKVPVLFQMPPTLWLNVDPFRVVPVLIVTFPKTDRSWKVLTTTVPPVMKFPRISKCCAGIVTVPEPLKINVL